MAAVAMPAQASVDAHLRVLFWEDVFVVVDDGRAAASSYELLGGLVRDHAARHPRGVGCLTIVPPDASPPPEHVRAAMTEVLLGLRGSLRCMCWHVEGTGFHGAMARGVLTGMRLLLRRPYPTHIASSLEDGVTWILSQLRPPTVAASRSAEALREIRRQRNGLAGFPVPSRSRG